MNFTDVSWAFVVFGVSGCPRFYLKVGLLGRINGYFGRMIVCHCYHFWCRSQILYMTCHLGAGGHGSRGCLPPPVPIAHHLEILSVQLRHLGKLLVSNLFGWHLRVSTHFEEGLFSLVWIDIARGRGEGTIELIHRDASLPQTRLKYRLIGLSTSRPVLRHIHLICTFSWSLDAFSR